MWGLGIGARGFGVGDHAKVGHVGREDHDGEGLEVIIRHVQSLQRRELRGARKYQYSFTKTLSFL